LKTNSYDIAAVIICYYHSFSKTVSCL